jgi:RNA-directed DNA polymerase
MPLPFEQVEGRVTDPTYVISHSFLPFIGYTDKQRRFRKISVSVKCRPIKYCAHFDGYMHSYYAMLLVRAYEAYLSNTRLNKVVIGYRSGIGSNVTMAARAFREIKARGNCVAVAIDITDFFGSIDHAILLANMKRILNESRLPDDWFKIYKSMTKYAWVEISDLCERLSLDKNDLPRPICTVDILRQVVRPIKDNLKIIQQNKAGYGIPQGSPISAVMSNVYMIDFDRQMFALASRIGAYYRRYSDDILFICSPGDEAIVRPVVLDAITCLGEVIAINDDKTEVCHFAQSSGMKITCNNPLTYLGFTFDGTRVMLRGRTLSRYFRRMSYATRHTAKAAIKRNANKIYKRKLFREFSHLGKSNFYSYAKDASLVMEDNTPSRQLRRHFKILDRKLKTSGR